MVRFYEPSEMRRRGTIYIILGFLPILFSILMNMWFFIIFGISFILSGVNLLGKAKEWEFQIEENKSVGRDVDTTYTHSMRLGFPFRGNDHSKEAFNPNKMQRANEKTEQREFDSYYEDLKYKKQVPSSSHRRTQIQKYEFCDECGNKMPAKTIFCDKCGHNLFT